MDVKLHDINLNHELAMALRRETYFMKWVLRFNLIR